MALATPKKRPKLSKPINPNSDKSPSSSSSSSTITSLFVDNEPPPNLLPSKSDLLNLFTVAVISTVVAFTCHVISDVINRPPKPFCDTHSFLSFSDTCEPCPSNGRCHNGQLECIQGYRKYGKLCLEDGDINETALKFSELAQNRLCEAHAEYKCDGTGTIWVSEDDLKIMFDESGLVQSSTVNNIKYMYIKERTMEYTNKIFDARTSIEGVNEFKCPDTLADSYKSMTCHARLWLAKHFLILISVCSLLAGCMLLLLRIRRRMYLKNRAEQLYDQVCEILEENALASKSTGNRESWLVASRLRDHLLSPKERKDSLLWKMAEELVELDSRVERYPKLVKGETKVVWEWQVEGSLSSSMKKKEVGSEKTNAHISRSLYKLWRAIKI